MHHLRITRAMIIATAREKAPGGLTTGLTAHLVPARLHAGRVRPARRSRSLLRRQAPVTWSPVRKPQLHADERVSEVEHMIDGTADETRGDHDAHEIATLAPALVRLADAARLQ